MKASSSIKLSCIRHKTDKRGGVINSHKTVLTETDLIGAASVPVVAGIWQELGSYVVCAGEAVQVGDFRGSTMESANGRFFLELKDDTQ